MSSLNVETIIKFTEVHQVDEVNYPNMTAEQARNYELARVDSEKIDRFCRSISMVGNMQQVQITQAIEVVP